MTCDFCPEKIRGIPDASGRYPVLLGDDWYVLPSLGPLAELHVLLIPQEHRFTTMSSEQHIAIVEQATTIWASLVAPRFAISFEHANSSTGCGITHAHVHMMGVDARLSPSIFGPAVATTFQNVARARDEIFWFLNGEHPFVQHGAFRSQFGRERIASALGLPEFDWREGSNLEWLASSQDAAVRLAEKWG